MIWMDSYAKIHALTLGWVTCEDDLTDWTDETLWPLVYPILISSPCCGLCLRLW